jgi:hypothetical protein
MKYLKPLFLSLFVFGLFGWIYIAINAEVHPETLSLPLTHLLDFPREDTFGTLCFFTSFISFFVWNVLKEHDKHK